VTKLEDDRMVCLERERERERGITNITRKKETMRKKNENDATK